MQVDKTMIIAEAGVNHNGNLAYALELIDVAVDAGADWVKFQTFKAEKIAIQNAPKAYYQKKTTNSSEDQLTMLRRLELSISDHERLIERCEKKGIGFMSTAFDDESLDLLTRLGQKIFKIPSGELTNLPYLRRVGSLNKRLIVSTGMANLEEIQAALSVLNKAGTPLEKITVLHCTSQYPAPYPEVNLRVIPELGKQLGVEMGYSDHTLGIEVSIAAVALGATVIEKHFTLNRGLEGPDHAASLEPPELASMVTAIRHIEQALGSSIKQPTPSELDTALVARKSIVAARQIRRGEILSEENLTTKRPGTGISAMHWDQWMGRVAQRDYKVDELIQP